MSIELGLEQGQEGKQGVSGMKSFLSPGKYLMTSWENYADFLEKLGVPLLLRCYFSVKV